MGGMTEAITPIRRSLIPGPIEVEARAPRPISARRRPRASAVKAAPGPHPRTVEPKPPRATGEWPQTGKPPRSPIVRPDQTLTPRARRPRPQRIGTR